MDPAFESIAGTPALWHSKHQSHKTLPTPNSKHTHWSCKTKSHSPNEPEEVSTKKKGITSIPDPCNAEQCCLCYELLFHPSFHWIQRDFHHWFQEEKKRVLYRAEPKWSSFLPRDHCCVVVKITIRTWRRWNTCKSVLKSSSCLQKQTICLCRRSTICQVEKKNTNRSWKSCAWFKTHKN